MTSGQMIALVARREVRDRLGNRGYMVTTLVTLLVVVGFIVVPTLFRDDGPTTYELGLVGDVPASFVAIADQGAQAREVVLEVEALPDREAAVEAVEAGDVEAVLVDGRELLVEDEANPRLYELVNAAVAQAVFLEDLADAGVEREQALSLLRATEPVEVVTTEGASEAEREAGLGVGFVTTVLLFMMIQINGSSLMTGTIEEKSSRVVEVLLGTLRPWQLLAGKLAGMAALAVGQFVLYAAAILGSNAAVGAFELPEATGSAVVVGGVMFLLGFGLYAALFAVAGALATSVEDAQASAGPLGLLVVSVYFAVIVGVVPNPDGMLSRVLTFLPPSAPFAVPVRQAGSAIAGWEVALAAIATAVGTVLVVRLAGRLYSAAILSGGKLTWREVVRADPIA